MPLHIQQPIRLPRPWDSPGKNTGVGCHFLLQCMKVKSENWKWSRSVVSDPQRPHGLQLSRLLHPWDFPGKSTGVGCHCLLWKIGSSLPLFTKDISKLQDYFLKGFSSACLGQEGSWLDVASILPLPFSAHPVDGSSLRMKVSPAGSTLETSRWICHPAGPKHGQTLDSEGKFP